MDSIEWLLSKEMSLFSRMSFLAFFLVFACEEDEMIKPAPVVYKLEQRPQIQIPPRAVPPRGEPVDRPVFIKMIVLKKGRSLREYTDRHGRYWIAGASSLATAECNGWGLPIPRDWRFITDRTVKICGWFYTRR